MSTPTKPRSGNVLIAACGAHAIQDGLVALQYVLLPILAQSLGLSYAQIGLLRSVSATTMSLLEIPAGILAERTGERRLLVAGLIAAGLGYLCVAHASTFVTITLGFMLAGAGAGFQHSLSSAVIVSHFDDAARRKALGSYNSSGDGGKLAFTALFSAGIGVGLGWNAIVTALAVVAIVFAFAVSRLLRHINLNKRASSQKASSESNKQGWGITHPRRFTALSMLVFLDSTVQAVFLTFLAFILLNKGAAAGTAASAVVLALAGGMIGKFCAGFMAARFGDRVTFNLLQLLTIAGFAALTWLPVSVSLILLPAIGLVVQGSSTVSYGSVADFVSADRQARGYALIYTIANGASVTGPLAFGLLADWLGLDFSMLVAAVLVMASMLFSLVLSSNREAVTA